MRLGNSNANRQKLRNIAGSIVCFMFIFCWNFTASIILAEEQPFSETEIDLPTLNNPGMEDELVYVNFDQVDIRIMLKTIGEITGINFIVDDSISGTVTVISPTKIRLGEIYEVLESILDVKGYAADGTPAV